MICTSCGQEMRSTVDDYTMGLCAMCKSQFSNSFSKIASVFCDPEITRLKAEIEQMKNDRTADIDGILALRRECEAPETETFPAFVKRLYAENKKLKQEVVDHMEWARKVATDPEFAPAMEIIKKLTAAENRAEKLQNVIETIKNDPTLRQRANKAWNNLNAASHILFTSVSKTRLPKQAMDLIEEAKNECDLIVHDELISKING